MIDSRSVEVFYWVVRLGGFRRAAERLGTTQPAVSARVAGLEAAVGVLLLERGQRRAVRPTAAGVLMMSFAERQLALAAEMAAAFGDGDLGGRVRVGVAETLVHTWLSLLLQRLHAAYPRLVVDVVVDVSVKLRAGLLAGEVDVALLLGPVAAPGVRDAFLCEYELAFVVSEKLDVGAGPLGLGELTRFPLITYPRETAPYQQLVRAMAVVAGAGAARVFGNASMSSIVRMVADGIGIGVVAPAAIGEVLAGGGLRVMEGVAGLLPAPLHFTASWRDGPGGVAAGAVARMAIEVAGEDMIAAGDQT